MSASELITTQHLARKALIYIRQSSPHQPIDHQESLRLQYALRQRALELGWAHEQIEVIDCDLGTSAAGAEHREGFKEVLAQVTLGEAGIILSFDVARLSRNCSHWYPLLDVCAYKGCLIADRDGVYDPSSPNGRLLLGLKGQISELELHTIRARLTAGLLNKAERGELALTLPAGLERDSSAVVHKDPNVEVQTRLELIFTTFVRVRSACKVVDELNRQGLAIPRRDRFGEVCWRQPTVAAILSILKHPAYAGAFTYGRTRTLRTGPGPDQATVKQLPIEQWRICVQNKYPAYIDWTTYEQIQAMIQSNHAAYDRNKTRGVPRPGKALLHGLVYCGGCGHKMVVQYKGGTRYLCNYLRQQYRVPVCQNIPADPVDAYVVQAFFAALSSVELDAYSRTMKAQQHSAQALDQAQRQQLERLRYQAALAERYFNQADPDNRLVTAELERRWELALRELKQAEQSYEKTHRGATAPAELSPELKAAFSAIGQKLPELWSTELFAQTQKKALLRCLIDKVVIHRIAPDQVRTRIVWKGGDNSSADLPIAVGSLAELTHSAELEERIQSLHRQGMDDLSIAQQLSSQGYRSPLHTNVLLPSTVKGIRLKHRLFIKPSQSHPRRISGFLTLPQLARALDIPRHWLYDRIHNGTIVIGRDGQTGLYLFPDHPHTLEQLKQLRAGQLKQLHFDRADRQRSAHRL